MVCTLKSLSQGVPGTLGAIFSHDWGSWFLIPCLHEVGLLVPVTVASGSPVPSLHLLGSLVPRPTALRSLLPVPTALAFQFLFLLVPEFPGSHPHYINVLGPLFVCTGVPIPMALLSLVA